MYYYQHHIGDFIRDTSNLTDSQLAAYLRLLWVYYDTEQPLEDDLDALAFKIRANASDVQQILKHYFTPQEDGFYHHKRCDLEILAYHSKSDKAVKSANARWNNANAMRTQSERNANAPVFDANQEPITNNHKTTTKYIPPIGDKLLADWLEVRKAKRSGKLTETAFKGLEREAGLAGLTTEQAVQVCCERSWVSFKADWMVNKQSTNVQDARLKVAQQIFGGQHGNDRSPRDITPGHTTEGDGEAFPKALAFVRQPTVG